LRAPRKGRNFFAPSIIIPLPTLAMLFCSGLCSQPSWIICGLNIHQWPISTSPGLSGEIPGDERAQKSKGAALKPEEVPGLIVPTGVTSTKALGGTAVFNARLHPPRESFQSSVASANPCTPFRSYLLHPELAGFLRERLASVMVFAPVLTLVVPYWCGSA